MENNQEAKKTEETKIEETIEETKEVITTDKKAPEKQEPKQQEQNNTNNNYHYNNYNKNAHPRGRVSYSSSGWHRDIKKAVIINDKIQKDRLNPHYKLNLNTTSKVRITPLGGLGEIGGNICVIETENSAILVDVGMSFPSDDMHGVDILVPDFTYLRQIRDKIRGIVITHAHEDHIGAMPYLFKELQFPVYATPLALGMIANKFDEHGIRHHKTYFRAVEKRKQIRIADFEVEWIHITHSIIDSSALAITTDAGTIIHTGDFKIDHTPIDGYPTDLGRLAYYGERGVLLLLSDSTNSYNEGMTKSEATVGPTFDRIYAAATGRVIMSTFSSNIHRVYQAIKYAMKYNRKICVIGRSMERNLDIAMDLGYIYIPKNAFIDPHEVHKHQDKDVLIVTTGSQGEPMSALYRMATNEHRHIKIKSTDTIIISAKAIPGNERSVSNVLNYLLKAGATVAYKDFSEIHVSGHAAQEEQKLMLRLVKPKFFLPVHGEYNHVVKHRDTALKCGILEKNVLLMNDGDTIEISPKYMRKAKTVKTGKVFIDNQLNNQIENNVILDRQKLANDGIVQLIVQISSQEHILIDRPKVTTYGLVGDREDRNFAKEMEQIITQYLQNARKEVMSNNKVIENEIRQVVRKHIFRKMKKYPLIVPTVFIM